MIPLLEGALVGYALGSFPTAYLLVRWQTGLDIRQEGSGNVGGRNAYEVTGSRAIGLLTGLGDALKGLLALLVAGLLWRGDPNVLWASAVGSVAGHNYNLWLSLGAGRLSGGKGLATAGAILLLLAPWVVLAWCLLWWASYRFWLRDINRANIVATLWVGPLGGWPCGAEAALALGILSALVLGKHLPDARRWWAELKA
ncbi:MAG: glycerol-3-phosphate acyltransferase [Bacteroidota bacterium]|nr:glycerol-3-phosphate acyltransferase [Rhodothermia bacterium]MDW8285882.1 glycerol-3-phosphate acyltransferase [Bacteroidota bacterium]